MKKILLVLLLVALRISNVQAAAGDTTWVQAHADKWLDWYNNFDTTVYFPNEGKAYRKIYMVFTLGKYVCPGSPQWCSDWDYTIQNFLLPKAGNGDTVELGRLISPYANTISNGVSTPASWKKRYIYDVTDYYSLLKDSATVRLHYSGYSGGFTANIKFMFIEGTPARNVIRVDKIYDGSHNYGDPSNSIENLLVPVTKLAPAGTKSAEMAFIVTGHGADDNGCSEFCSKFYDVMLNGNNIFHKDIWRNTCGLNSLYPQSGTWIYDRGNWCPGDMVETFHHPLTGINSAGNYTVDVDFENYTKSGSGTPSYTVSANVVYYGDVNRTLDADLLDIIAPNTFEGYSRENSLCGTPKIKVKNNGKQTINSIRFEYGVTGNIMPYYIWNGTINSLQEATIFLPEPWSLRTISGNTSIQNFEVKIIDVNGQKDEDGTNDSMIVPFKPAPKWPVNIVVRIYTNNSQQNGYSETSWKILDLNGNIVAKRDSLAPTTVYEDTIILGPSCYKLVVEDLGCDGLHFWNNPSGGNGTFQVRKASAPVSLSLSGYFSGDFGCGFNQYFTTDWPTSVETILNANEAMNIEAFPNPANHDITVQLTGVSIEGGNIQIIDALGRIVATEKCISMNQKVNTDKLNNGVYSIIFNSNSGKLQTRLLIVH